MRLRLRFEVDERPQAVEPARDLISVHERKTDDGSYYCTARYVIERIRRSSLAMPIMRSHADAPGRCS